MFTRTLFTAALATTYMVAALQPIDFCLAASQQFGNDGNGTQGYHDTMNGLNRVADRAIFYTTVRAIEVCYDENYIHGLDIELMHDERKDRKGVYTLEYVQPDKLSRPRDFELPEGTVHAPIEGSDVGTCEWIQVPAGSTISSIGFHNDVNSVRSMNLSLSNGKNYEFGYDKEGSEYNNFESSDFYLNGQALIGFRAQVDSHHARDASGEPHIKNISLLINQCTDEELFQMSQGVFPENSELAIEFAELEKEKVLLKDEDGLDIPFSEEVDMHDRNHAGHEAYEGYVAPARNGNKYNPSGRTTDELHQDYNEQLVQQNKAIMIMMGVLIFLGTLIATSCCYLILKNRGTCYKGGKRQREGAAESTVQISGGDRFSSAGYDSQSKLSAKQNRDAYRARQVPSESISSLAQIGVQQHAIVITEGDNSKPEKQV